MTTSGTTQEVSTVLSGTGGVSVNTNATGGGTVRLTALNTYTGPTTLGCGTLWINSLADGGQPSSVGASPAGLQNLLLGPGTLRYDGPAVSTDRGIRLQAGGGKAVTLWLDSDASFGGQVTVASGTLIKRGPGTLALAYGGAQNLGSGGGATAFSGDFPANGDSPTLGFQGVLIADGKLVLGADGQNNTLNSQVFIGGWTTTQPGQETTGELEIVGGYTSVGDHLLVGRNNGTLTTAGGRLNPRLTVRGGTLSCSNIGLVYDNTRLCSVDAEINIFGGTLHIARAFRMGDTRGDATHPSTATLNIYGGALIATNNTEDSTSGITFGWSTPAPEVFFNIHGGLVHVGTDMKMGQNASVSHLALHGGILRCRNITGSSGAEYVVFNGAIFQPTGDGRNLNGLTEALVSTNGLTVDTSYAGPEGYFVDQTLTHDPALGAAADGGIVKRGAGLFTLRGAGHTFTGPVRVEEGILLGGQNALPGLCVDVAPGAVFGTHSPTSVDSLTLGEVGQGAARATLDLAVVGDGSVVALTVTNALTAHAAEVRLHTSGALDPVFPSGVHTALVFRAASPAPDPAAFSGSSAFPAKSAAFAVVDIDADWKAVVMTVADAYGPGTWVAGSGGAWENALNWDSPPPNLPGARALFTNALPADAAVTLAGPTTVGKLTLGTGAAGGVTFSGSPFLFDNGDIDTAVTALSGAHAFANAVTFAGQPTLDTRAGASVTFAGAASSAVPIRTNPQTSGGGTVAFAGPSGPAGAVTNGSGTLRVSAFPAGGVTWGGTLRYDGPETETAAPLAPNGGSSRAAILSVVTNVTFTGPVTAVSGAFIKRGPGTARFTYPGVINLTAGSGSESTDPQTFPENGDSPATGFPYILVAEGRLALGAPGQSTAVSSGIFIGGQITGAGMEATTGELEILGGTHAFNGHLLVGRNNGHAANSPAEPLCPRFILRDGVVNACPGGAVFALGYDNQNAHSIHAFADVYGGTLRIQSAGVIRMGDAGGNGAVATFNLYGGEVLHTNATGSVIFGNGAKPPVCEWNQFGGLMWTRGDMALGYNGSLSRLNLHGGVLRARNITTTPTGDEHIFFNGGVFQPLDATAMTANPSSAVVSTNGAAFDTSYAAGAFTVPAVLTHDPALGAEPDGGLLKSGAGTLVLSAVNTFTGPVTVTGGVLRATVDGAVPDRLHVYAEGTFDANGATRRVRRVSGAGACVNGTVHVTAELAPDAGAALAFANLTFGTNAVWRVGGGRVASVSGALSAEGAGEVDFGRDAGDPLPYPFSVVVATYGTSGASFAGWRALGTGHAPGAYAVRLVRDETVTPHVVRAELAVSGTLISVR